MIPISCFCPVKPQPSSISMAPLGTASCTPVGGLQPCTVSLHRRQLPRASVDGHRTDLKRYGCTLLPGWKACVGSFSMENYECSAEDPFYSCRVLLTPTVKFGSYCSCQKRAALCFILAIGITNILSLLLGSHGIPF